MIDLQPFCANADTLREVLEKPFPHGDYTYATDGRILVRVPLAEYPSEPDKAAPDPTKIGKYNHDEITDWIPIPELPVPYLEDCRRCNGTGRQKTPCDRGFHHECIECDEGKCRKTVSVQVGVALASDVYLGLIAALPNPCLHAEGPEVAIAFKFDGGVGYLMPMRK